MTENRADIRIERLDEPTQDVIEALNIWENDPEIIPFIRPISGKEDLSKKRKITEESLRRRLETHEEYLIYLKEQLIGQLSIQIDPGHIAKKVKGTAWIGIYIGEKEYRGRGAGTLALKHVESILRLRGIRRIELGVFEFNKAAYRLYRRLGYEEFIRLDELAWWNDSMWRDIRMEKYLE